MFNVEKIICEINIIKEKYYFITVAIVLSADKKLVWILFGWKLTKIKRWKFARLQPYNWYSFSLQFLILVSRFFIGYTKQTTGLYTYLQHKTLVEMNNIVWCLYTYYTLKKTFACALQYYNVNNYARKKCLKGILCMLKWK